MINLWNEEFYRLNEWQQFLNNCYANISLNLPTSRQRVITFINMIDDALFEISLS